MPSFISSQKQKLRKEILKEFSLQFLSIRETAGNSVCRFLSSDALFLNSKVIGLFAAGEGEIPTSPIFEMAIKMNKKILFPRVEEDQLHWILVTDWLDLRPGYKGILEPQFGKEFTGADIDVMFVPGVAFDHLGSRLGKGKGFYDRFLASPFPPKRTVGLGFSFQCVESLPTEEHDQKVDAVLTENGWYTG